MTETLAEQLESEESMFVQTARAVESDGATLTLQGITPSTLYFSDRPERVVGVGGWSEPLSDGRAARLFPGRSAEAVEGRTSHPDRPRRWMTLDPRLTSCRPGSCVLRDDTGTLVPDDGPGHIELV
jgi:hypothetical protein